MGIPGLTKYMSNRSDDFYTKCALRDTNLVIDGKSLSSQLYKYHATDANVFGGDYDVFDGIVRNFFANLFKCNVTPIVIMDGGHEEKKLNTIRKRIKRKIDFLKDFHRETWNSVFFPLLLSQVFAGILVDLNVIAVQCFFEADREIAAVAKHLNCPVLSYDSDFFIFDVMYIPFDMIGSEPEKCDSGFYLPCSIYNVTTFLDKFEGLEQPLLPLMPALLGNDYVNAEIFRNFFQHVILPVNQSATFTQRRISGLIDWLKSESLESATELIKSHLSKKIVDSAMEAINSTIEDYKISKPVVLPLLRLDNPSDPIKPLIYGDEEWIRKLPEKFVLLFQSCKLPSYFIDIIQHKQYYMGVQVEDVTEVSSHTISFPIINAIGKILNSLIDDSSSHQLVLYLKMYKNLKKETLTDSNVNHCFDGVNVRNIMSEPLEIKLNLIYSILSFNDSDIVAISQFDDVWITFVISLIYWFKNSNGLSATHFHAILSMAIANYVQSRVGRYRNYSTFMRHRGGQLNRLSKIEIPEIDPEKEWTFYEILASITEFELLEITKLFVKLRQIVPEVTEKGYFIPTIHLFASLQSVLAHVTDLNALMDFPLPTINFAHLYTGTLLYNLYYLFNKKTELRNFVLGQFENMPNIRNLYLFFLEKLSGYLPGETKVEKPRKFIQPHGPRRKRRRR